MVPEVFAFSEALDEALEYFDYLMFRSLHLLVENSQLSQVKDYGLR